MVMNMEVKMNHERLSLTNALLAYIPLNEDLFEEFKRKVQNSTVILNKVLIRGTE